MTNNDEHKRENPQLLKKKKRKSILLHEEEAELWLISYADMMTVLACFFIVLVALGNFDPVQFSKMGKQISDSFTGVKSDESMTQLEALLQEIELNPKLKDTTKLRKEDNGVAIKFTSSALFESASAELTPETKETVDVLINLIYTSNPNYNIKVEGHTDGSPLKTTSQYHSNWELSAARASRLVERFEAHGFNKRYLSATGFGSSQPLFEEQNKNGTLDLEHMKSNRRVIITVTAPDDIIEKEPLGLGHILKEYNVVKPKQQPTKADF